MYGQRLAVPEATATTAALTTAAKLRREGVVRVLVVDLSALPWLDSVRADLALWSDRADVGLDPSSPVDRMLARYPVLDAGRRLQGRDAQASARLRNVYLFGAAGMPSVGPQCGGINTLPVGSDTVVHAVTQQLFTQKAEQVVTDFLAATEEELPESLVS